MADDPAELFAVLDELAGRYRLRPLLAVVAGTPAATPAAAAAIVEGTPGGIVLDVSPSTDTPAAVAETVVELGELLGYVRVPAHELGAATAPGLLATLPPQVPVVIGEPPTPSDGGDNHGAGDRRPRAADHAAAPAEGDMLARLTAWRAAVDEILRHPSAAER